MARSNFHQLWDAAEPDLVILDVVMLDLDSLEVLS